MNSKTRKKEEMKLQVTFGGVVLKRIDALRKISGMRKRVEVIRDAIRLYDVIQTKIKGHTFVIESLDSRRFKITIPKR